MTQSNLKYTTLLLAAVSRVEAALPIEGPWNGSHTSGDFTFTNGIPSHTDEYYQRRITSPQALEENLMTDYTTMENVVRVQSILTEQQFNDAFPDKDDFYTYQNFLRAVAKYPAFCNEYQASSSSENLGSIEESCKRELSTLLAHIEINSEGLQQKENESCSGSSSSACTHNQSDLKYPASSGQQYYERGPIGMRGSRLYGMFGDSFGPISYKGKQRFLDNPDLILQDSYVAFSSAIFMYMTPDGSAPSMHDIMTGFWTPNGQDQSAGFVGGFGSTIFIASYGDDCGKWSETDGAADRKDAYRGWIQQFGLDTNESMTCSKTWGEWNWSGSHNLKKKYLVKGKWNNEGTCEIVNYVTEYSPFVQDDYKRCICDTWNMPEMCENQEQEEEESEDEEAVESEEEPDQDDQISEGEEDEEDPVESEEQPDQDDQESQEEEEEPDQDDQESEEGEDEEEVVESEDDQESEGGEDEEEVVESEDDQESEGGEDEEEVVESEDDQESEGGEDEEEVVESEDDQESEGGEDEEEVVESEEDQESEAGDDDEEVVESEEEPDQDDQDSEEGEDEQASEEADEEDDQEGSDSIQTLYGMFQQIWQNEDYSEDEHSYTTFQVDANLDYIEQVLDNIHDVMVAQGLIITQ